MAAGKGCSRRAFLQAGAVGLSAALLLPRRAWGANGDVRVAVIGCGNMGGGDRKSVV